MKKFILASLAFSLSLSASAGIEVPQDFSKTFNETAPSLQLQGWTIYAPEGTVAKSISDFFPRYSPENGVQPLYAYLNYGIWSPSEFTNGQPSDTWLITPEIEITYDEEILSFSVENYGMPQTVRCNYSVYISETGVEKSDFTLLDTGTLNGGGLDGINYTSSPKRILIENMKGKKVHIAFVNEGNTQGMMGFVDINLANWYIANYPQAKYFDKIFADESTVGISFPIRLCTPVEAQGYTVVTKTSNGYEASYDNTRKYTMSSIISQTITVNDIPVDGDFVSYSITITPNFEGAVPVVFSGDIVKVANNYDYVGVMEEATGTWCGWCPYGAAALSYYSNKYNGENGAHKAIGIAVHGGSQNEPMMIPSTISDYYEQWMINLGNGGYPAVAVNRIQTLTPSPNPTGVGAMLEELFPKKTYATSKLSSVNLFTDQNNKVEANFNVEASYNTEYAPLYASIILTEDNVQGNSSLYNQTTYVSSYGNDNASTIANRLGQDWVPYFEPYFGTSTVIFRNIQYDHVARAAFPTYAGVQLPATPAAQSYSGKIEFNIPKNVMIQENINAVLVILNAQGEIVAADEISYDEFNITDAVEAISADNNISASFINGVLTVSVAENVPVNVYAIDGTQLIKADAQPGDNTYELGNSSNVIIVKAGNKTFKLFNK